MKVDLDYVASLAELEIPGEKRAKYEKDITSILDMLGDLPDVSGVNDALSPEDNMVLRQDVPTKSLSREEALQNAAEVQAGCVVVPRTVE